MRRLVAYFTAVVLAGGAVAASTAVAAAAGSTPSGDATPAAATAASPSPVSGSHLPLSWTESQPVLEHGDRGPAVAAWQQRMNDWIAAATPAAVSPLTVDAVFGPATEAVTNAFQESQGITVDGVVGPVTRAAFLSAPSLAVRAVDPAADVPYLEPGDTGSAVSTWQAALNRWFEARHDDTRIAVDGVFGPRTEAASRVFQDAQRITVDGLVGPETRAAMMSAPALVGASPA